MGGSTIGLRIGGLTLFSRASNGDLHIASYHPRRYATWVWYLSLSRRNAPKSIIGIEPNRGGQWHHHLRLPFGRTLWLGRQDYHLGRS